MQTHTQSVNGFDQAVLTATWRCDGLEEINGQTYHAYMTDICTFQQPKSDASFTPYNQLTQDEVLGWVWATGVPADEEKETPASGVIKEDIEASVNNIIRMKSTPPVVVSALPWA
jgi:hypothetical protein